MIATLAALVLAGSAAGQLRRVTPTAGGATLPQALGPDDSPTFAGAVLTPEQNDVPHIALTPTDYNTIVGWSKPGRWGFHMSTGDAQYTHEPRCDRTYWFGYNLGNQSENVDVAGEPAFGYRLETYWLSGVTRDNNAQSGGASTITLDSGASALDDAYKGFIIILDAGTGIGQVRQITDYVGATKVASVNAAWAVQPVSGTGFQIFDPWIEYHTIYNPGTGDHAKRLDNWTISRANWNTSCRRDITASTISLNAMGTTGDYSGAQCFRIDMSDTPGLSSFAMTNGGVFRHDTNNVQMFAQKNAAGSGYVNMVLCSQYDQTVFNAPAGIWLQNSPIIDGQNAMRLNLGASSGQFEFRNRGLAGEPRLTGTIAGTGGDTLTYTTAVINKVVFSGVDLIVGTAGKGLQVKEGSNAKMGAATLVAGSATVSTTAVTATSRIFLTSQADGGTPGWLRVSGRTAATSFTITSSSGTDTSTVAWIIVEPAP